MFNIHRNVQSAVLVLGELRPGSEQLQTATHSLGHEALCDVNTWLFSHRSSIHTSGVFDAKSPLSREPLTDPTKSSLAN